MERAKLHLKKNTLTIAVLFPMFEEGIYYVSVLIPVYGVEQYIERCARSLFEQTYPDLEYVFVNDCTHDRSVEILRKVIEDYPERKGAVRIINHEKNKGLAATRNTCLENASGEFVCCVDSDDWLELDAIENLVKKQLETDADIVSGNMQVHNPSSLEDYFEPHYENKEQMVLNQLPSTMDHNAIRRIIRRALFEDHQIRCIEGADMGEDRFQMVQVCYFAQKVSNIDQLVYHYEKRNAQSITNQIRNNLLLRNLGQELENWLGILTFFEDKEEVYYQASIMYAIECIQKIITLSLRHNNKDYYCRTVKIIRDNKVLMGAMGWNRDCFDVIRHNYYLMWMNSFANRSIRFVRRLPRRFLATVGLFYSVFIVFVKL